MVIRSASVLPVGYCTTDKSCPLPPQRWEKHENLPEEVGIDSKGEILNITFDYVFSKRIRVQRVQFTIP